MRQLIDVHLLQVIAAGGICTNARKVEAGMEVDPLCPHCGLRVETDHCFFWESLCIQDITDSCVLRTSNFRVLDPTYEPEAYAACYWLRGITHAH